MSTWTDYVPDWLKTTAFDASQWDWSVPAWFSSGSENGAEIIDQSWIDEIESAWAREDAIKKYTPWVVGLVMVFLLWRAFLR
ncbi:hypothetical protein [Magnetovibrio blakemorei]|uniref:Uncharacterized protein n=1 Tax=Magnetovibrio blakemorei TaxID=28181 RepID=A0A1E5Q4D4_9PROT|nr:hypothetical protein [Magnetovibrio blakemorei]OEJ64644.1 hypothetical protein BEN30_00705 [Magnetovibrio blakemorei]